jgi:hypothetical protein
MNPRADILVKVMLLGYRLIAFAAACIVLYRLVA